MELVNIFIELSSLSCDIFQRLIVIAVSLGIEPYFACYLKLVKNTAQAVGNALSFGQSLTSDSLILFIELVNLISEFLLVVLHNGNFFLQIVVLLFEGIHLLLGNKSALGEKLLVSSGNAEVEDVANSGKEVGVVETSFPKCRSITEEVSFEFAEDIASVANSIAEAKTAIQLASCKVCTTGVIVAKCYTSTTE